MKKTRMISVFALIFLFFSSPGFAYGDGKADLTDAIYALQVTSGVRSVGTVIDVPAQITTIQGAIDAAVSGSIINVAAGTYTETLTIKNKALILQGAGAASTTINGVSGADTLTIDTCRTVVVSGVTIQGGAYGIRATRGSVIEVSDAAVQDTADRGIRIDENSTARLKNVAVQRSGVDGISAFRGSSVTFLGTVASSNNARDGVSIADSSSAFLSGATLTVNANGRNGMNVVNNSGLMTDHSSIVIRNGLGNSTNNGMAIQAYGSSSIHIQFNSSLLSEDNSLDGLAVGAASNGYVDGTSTLTVRGAKRYGLNVWSNSSLSLAGATLVENSALIGANISLASNFFIQAAVTLQNNTTVELSISNGGTAYIDPTAMLTVSRAGGLGTGINLAGKGALTANGGLLVQNAAAGINIATGSTVSLTPATPKTVAVQNNGTGIYVRHGSGLFGSSGGTVITIKGNTSRDLDISLGSWVSLLSGTYDTINCSQSVTTMGVSCP